MMRMVRSERSSGGWRRGESLQGPSVLVAKMAEFRIGTCLYPDQRFSQTTAAGKFTFFASPS